MQIETTQQDINRKLKLHSFEEALAEIEKLQSAERVLVSTNSWDLPHVFDHCRRSIFFAMEGFPELKSKFFRGVIGPAAFHVFNTMGKMSHNRMEEIPGCDYSGELTLEQSIQNLRETIEAFNTFDKALHPHFAYGKLSKKQVQKANAMHIADHLCLIEY